jgi:hypothetical protein
MKSVEETNEKLECLISLMDHIETQLKEILNNGNLSDNVFFRLKDEHISFLNLKIKISETRAWNIPIDKKK